MMGGVYFEASIENEKSYSNGIMDFYYGLAFDAVGRSAGLDFDIKLGVNLRLESSSTVSFLFENENYFIIAPSTADGILGIFKPGVKFNQKIGDIGDLYAQTDFPSAYMNYGLQGDYFGLDLTFGWASSFGLGLEAGGHILLAPELLNGFTGLSFNVSFERWRLYAEVVTTIPIKNLKSGGSYSYFDTSAVEGISISPMIKYNFDWGFSPYIRLNFYRIGINKDVESVFDFATGVTFRF